MRRNRRTGEMLLGSQPCLRVWKVLMFRVLVRDVFTFCFVALGILTSWISGWKCDCLDNTIPLETLERGDGWRMSDSIIKLRNFMIIHDIFLLFWRCFSNFWGHTARKKWLDCNSGGFRLGQLASSQSILGWWWIARAKTFRGDDLEAGKAR